MPRQARRALRARILGRDSIRGFNRRTRSIGGLTILRAWSIIASDMDLNTTNEVREAIRAIPRAEWDALAQLSGVPRSTIEKIAYGVTANPSFDSMVGIVQAIRARTDDARP